MFVLVPPIGSGTIDISVDIVIGATVGFAIGALLDFATRHADAERERTHGAMMADEPRDECEPE
ncbi:MAG: hypothetical protein KDA85_18365 [Planctomycetaceae bacterium]|nr:hypothetical protein [Planctomycetaceae bacterium]